MDKKHAPIVYIDGVDFQHELGQALGGNRVYASAKDLIHRHSCAEYCGIVKARVELIEWVKPQDFQREMKELRERHQLAEKEQRAEEILRGVRYAQRLLREAGDEILKLAEEQAGEVDKEIIRRLRSG